jgi:hypothetical protein
MEFSKDFNLCNVLKKKTAHQLQGNTGANFGANNGFTLVWSHQQLTKPIPITTHKAYSYHNI